MVRLKSVFILAAFTLLIASCSPAARPSTPTNESTVAPTVIPTAIFEATSTALQSGLPLTEAEVPRVSVEDTVAAIQSGEAIIVDVRSLQAYQASHIPGAVSIPLGEIETNPGGLTLDKDKWIITYCT